jgi:fructose-bisphosphate aldolase class II
MDMATILKHAKANRYAVPAFNVWDLTSTYAARLAAEEEDAPIILAPIMLASEPEAAIRATETDLCVEASLSSARQSTMPMAVHVDHGKSFEVCMKGIRMGFTSVMIDASTLSYEENAAITKRIVDSAHPCGVTVEAELGHVAEGEDELTDELRAKLFTRPDEAIRFVEETGVDALAVSVGTLHGAYKFEPKLDFDLLQELCDRVPAYIVIHGGSGTPNLERVASMGVTKINIATESVTAWVEQIRKVADKSPWEAFMGINKGGIEATKKAMVARIRSFNANGKATDLLKGLL